MAIKQDWNNSRLTDYLLYGNWEPYNAWCVLAGFDYHAKLTRGVFMLNESHTLDIDAFIYFELTSKDVEVEIIQMDNNVDRLRNFWFRDDKDNDSYPPSYFIDWAISKRMAPEWLDWAIENKLYTTGNHDDVDKKSDPTEGMINDEAHDFVYGKVKKCEDVNQSEIVDKPLSTRTENNYLRLIMQLANNINGFNPKKPHEAASLIVKNTNTNLNEKTIAGYIQKAYELDSKERD